MKLLHETASIAPVVRKLRKTNQKWAKTSRSFPGWFTPDAAAKYLRMSRRELFQKRGRHERYYLRGVSPSRQVVIPTGMTLMDCWVRSHTVECLVRCTCGRVVQMTKAHVARVTECSQTMHIAPLVEVIPTEPQLHWWD